MEIRNTAVLIAALPMMCLGACTTLGGEYPVGGGIYPGSDKTPSSVYTPKPKNSDDAICSTVQVVANNSRRTIPVRFDLLYGHRSQKRVAEGIVRPGQTKEFGVLKYARGRTIISIDNNGQPKDSKYLSQGCNANNSQNNPQITGHSYRSGPGGTLGRFWPGEAILSRDKKNKSP